jgi:hypothetical protein
MKEKNLQSRVGILCIWLLIQVDAYLNIPLYVANAMMAMGAAHINWQHWCCSD